MRLFAVLFLLLAACGQGAPVAMKGGMVSLDLCADLHLLAFAPPSRIAALSPETHGLPEPYRSRAKAYPVLRPDAEALLAQAPDLVLRSYGGDARLLALLTRSGLRVEEIGWPRDLGGVRDNTVRVARLLGSGSPLPDMALLKTRDGGRLLYLTPSGVTSGPGTLVAEVMEAAGYEPYERRPGWHHLPLEALARTSPEAVMTGFFDSRARYEGRWDSARHPVARRALEDVPRQDISGGLLACPAFPLFDAARLLREGPLP
jgi:iron complex transport system substrate-binding protein